MTGFFEVALLLSAPILLAAAGELVLERAGSIQIGTEGTMLIGAFATFAAARRGGTPATAVLVGLVVGALFGLVFAAVAVVRRADPILVGTAWNLLALGVTAYGYRLVAGETGAVLEVRTLPHAIFGLPVLVVAAFFVPAVLHLFLEKTRPGLLLSAAGENPEAVLGVGGSVVAVRTWASVFAGAFAGLAGGLLIVTVSPTFVEGVTAGRGFLALALVVFARWKPLRLLPGALLLGGATALQYRLQATGSTNVPYAFLLALPGLLALSALAFSSARGGAPKALGTPAPE
ncbi:MAG TPA: ABC transporter permease [Thermoanaerobaculia bacterium]|nr:ABC transporter permease [Thermoanaerobaculia bacterium]